MKEVIRNLVENAVKFNTKPDRHVRLGARVETGLVQIRVSDNGPGIPPEEFEKIFNKFYQIEGSFTGQVQGMGLGLALVKRGSWMLTAGRASWSPTWGRDPHLPCRCLWRSGWTEGSGQSPL